MSDAVSIDGVSVGICAGAGIDGTAVVERNLREALSQFQESGRDPQLSIVLRGTPPSSLLRRGNFILIPQNAWVYTWGFAGLNDLRRKIGIRSLTGIAAKRSLGIIRISKSLPDYGVGLGPVIPNVLDARFEVEAAGLRDQASMMDDQRPLVSVVGSLTSYRGLDTFVAAMELLPHRYKFAVAGAPQNRHTVLRLETVAARRPNFDLSARRLQRTEALRMVAKSSVVVLPSRVEASPLSILEALALGKRVVASDIPGHREVINETNSRLEWFRPGDKLGLARAIERSLSAPPHPSSLQHVEFRRLCRREWSKEVVSQVIRAAARVRSVGD